MIFARGDRPARSAGLRGLREARRRGEGAGTGVCPASISGAPPAGSAASRRPSVAVPIPSCRAAWRRERVPAVSSARTRRPAAREPRACGHRRAADAGALGGGVAHPLLDTVADEFALHLRHRGEDREDEASGRAGRVELGLGERGEPDPGMLEVLQRREGMQRRAEGTVELPHHDQVDLPLRGIGQQPRQAVRWARSPAAAWSTYQRAT